MNIGTFQRSESARGLIEKARGYYIPKALPTDRAERTELVRDLFQQIEQVGSPGEKLVAGMTREITSRPGIHPSLAQSCWQAATVVMADMTPGSALTMGQVLGQIAFDVQNRESLYMNSPEYQVQEAAAAILREVCQHGTPKEQIQAQIGLADQDQGGLSSLYSASMQLQDWKNPNLPVEVGLGKMAWHGVDSDRVLRSIAVRAEDPGIREQARAGLENVEAGSQLIWELAQRARG